MKNRLALTLLTALALVILAINLTPSPLAAAPWTATYSPSPTEKRPTYTASPTWPLVSATAIPREPTHTSIPGETPQTSALQTLAAVETPTLILPGSVTPLPLSTATLIRFASLTPTPYGGTATPSIPTAYSLDGKPRPCYKGPSRAYIQMDTFRIAQLAGKDERGKWWFIVIYKGQGVFVECWVAVRQVRAGGNLASLPITEPGLPQLTDVKLDVSGQPAPEGEYVQTIACDALGRTNIRVAGQIFANGPIEQVGYTWETDAPGDHPASARAWLPAWDVPVRALLDLSVPSRAGSYSVTLRTTFPMEVSGNLKITLQCKE